MREKDIEQKLVAEVKRRGGLCPKWVSPGIDGVPDRLVFLPGKHFGMVEVKAPGKSQDRCRCQYTGSWKGWVFILLSWTKWNRLI